MKTTIYIALVVFVFAAVMVRLGALRGTRPLDLGVSNARLKPPSQTRNSVTSQADLYPKHAQHDYARIEALPLKADMATSMQALQDVLEGMTGIRVVLRDQDYLYAEAQTTWLRFVDDLEFWANPIDGVIELRSASRLGSEDFGVNRARIETIRAAYLARP